MNWITEPPTETGFYWWRQNLSWGLSIARIYHDGQTSRQSGEWWPERISEPVEDKQK